MLRMATISSLPLWVNKVCVINYILFLEKSTTILSLATLAVYYVLTGILWCTGARISGSNQQAWPYLSKVVGQEDLSRFFPTSAILCFYEVWAIEKGNLINGIQH